MPEWLRKALEQMSSEYYQQPSSNEPAISLRESAEPLDPDWMGLSEIYQKIMDVVIGYRTSAVSGGFDPHMADYMAVQLHTIMLQRMFS